MPSGDKAATAAATTGALSLATTMTQFQALSQLSGMDPKKVIATIKKAIKARSPALYALTKFLAPLLMFVLAAAPHVRSCINVGSSIRLFLEAQLKYSVLVEEYDTLYYEIIELAQSLTTSRGAREVRASMNGGRNPFRRGHDDKNHPSDGPPVLFRPSNNAVQTFTFRGKIFTLESYPEKVEKDTLIDRAYVRLSCWALNDKPLRDLLAACRNSHTLSMRKMTTIFLAQGDAWKHGIQKPARDIESVSLEQEVKDQLIGELTRFLNPEERKWYTTQGIPYRRGILAHGPPGTGKTSLSIALAGHFNLDIYIISFSDDGLNEKALNNLFDRLPGKCIVLLEDIDSAGIGREDKMSQPKKTKKTVSDKTKSNKDKSEKKPSISLSALLNVIDGVAAAEGRILILTTNCPNTLDKALIRPGRCDTKIFLGNASHEVITKLFSRIMSDPTKPDEQRDALIATHAAAFIAKVPDREFTPAEISSFLIPRRDNPKKAVDDADEFVRTTHELKHNGFEDHMAAPEPKPESEPEAESKSLKLDKKVEATETQSNSDVETQATAESLLELVNEHGLEADVTEKALTTQSDKRAGDNFEPDDETDNKLDNDTDDDLYSELDDELAMFDALEQQRAVDSFLHAHLHEY